MVPYSNWLKLSLSARNAVAHALGISKSGPIEVNSNQVVKDGYQLHDVENGLTVEKMQEYLGVKEKDPMILFDMVVAQAQGIERPMVVSGDNAIVLPGEPQVDKVVSKEGKAHKVVETTFAGTAIEVDPAFAENAKADAADLPVPEPTTPVKRRGRPAKKDVTNGSDA